MAPLAITYPGVVAVPEDAGEGPRREILIDATNPMGLDPDAGLCPHSHACVTRRAHRGAAAARTALSELLPTFMEELLDNRGLTTAVAVGHGDRRSRYRRYQPHRRPRPRHRLTPVLIGSLADSAPIGLAGLDPDADGGQRTPRQRWVSRVGSATSSSASTTSPGAVIIASWPVGSA